MGEAQRARDGRRLTFRAAAQEVIRAWYRAVSGRLSGLRHRLAEATVAVEESPALLCCAMGYLFESP
jgi:hypothetical protein